MTAPTPPTVPGRRRVRLLADTRSASRTVAAGAEGWGEPVYPGATLLLVAFDQGARLVLGRDVLELLG